jgi:hypothetical protein
VAKIIGFAGGAFVNVNVPGGDSVPDAFDPLISDQFAAALSTVVTSNSFTPTGYDTAAAISIATGEYELDNSGTWVATPGTINPGQSVRIRHTSSAANSTTTTSTLTIGGVEGTFSSLTIAAAGAGVKRPGRLLGGMMFGR